MSDALTITRMLHECRESEDPEAIFGSLMPLVYDDLKQIARQQLRRLRPGETLNTTALVHESYAKLQPSAGLDWTDRQHFFAIAARAMRQVVVDHARSLMAHKRSGQKVDIDLEQVPGNMVGRAEQIIHIDQLLDRLKTINPDLARTFECRYFAGYTQDETAELLDISVRTVQRRWTQACAWLRELSTADS